MAVLSRQGIIKCMKREEDPLEVYTVAKRGKRKNIPFSQINSHSINLSIGSKLGEIDPNLLLENLPDIPVLSRIDFLGYGGINPTKHREAIEKSQRILDLTRLNDYLVEDEDRSGYSWKVKTRDGYPFLTRVVVDKEDGNKASGIIIHPEKYDYMERLRHLSRACRDLVSLDEKFLDYLTSASESPKKDLKRKLKDIVTTTKIVKDCIRRPFLVPPSTSFVTSFTKEIVHSPLDLTGLIETKSRLARTGLSVHPSSGKVDAGFHNALALELKNGGNLPLQLNVGDSVAEIEFLTLDEPTNLGYTQRSDALYKRGETL